MPRRSWHRRNQGQSASAKRRWSCDQKL